MLIFIPIILSLTPPPFIGALQSGTPEGIAKEIARTQLEIFREIKERNPALAPKQLYMKTVSARPGYSDEQAKNIVKDAEHLAKEHDEKMGLRMTVFQLVAVEYLARTNQAPHKHFDDFWAVVSSIIPEDL